MQASHRFGAFEVHPGQRALLQGGAPLVLGGRAFDVLMALLERRGQLVSKDDLLDRVWGRVVVEEANLHVQISALRKLLGKSAIATVPGRGYRFEWDADPAVPAGAGAVARASHPGLLHGAAAGGDDQPYSDADAGDGLPALLGRDADLAALHTLLDRHRLVTVSGPGGIGKTRLARALLAQRHGALPDGAALVELAALTDPAHIPAAIAAAIDVPLGVSRDPLPALVAAVRPLRMLLLLDNAEHLVDGVAQVAQALLAGGAQLHLLVTSQVPLRHDGEQVYRLGGLAVPPRGTPAEQAQSFGAVALLVQRVQAADRHFALSAAQVADAIEICTQLDGIALAIELAAARCPLLGLRDVAQRLDARFRLLRAGSRTAPSRQQTLLAAMDWSHALLTDDQRRAFRRLGVFSGGFTLDLARQVLADDALDAWAAIELLAELVDRSLVASEGFDAPRYRLLETGRAYALESLAASGEEDSVRRRHAHAVRRFFEPAWDDCWRLPEAAFVAHYEPELDNLRAALDWSLAHDAACAVALAGSAARLWRHLSLHPEGLRYFALAQALIDADTPALQVARLWEGLAQLSGERSSTESGTAAQRAVDLFSQLGDRLGHFVALAHVAFSHRVASPQAQAAFAAMQQLEDPQWPPAVRLLSAKVEGGLASMDGRIEVARNANQRRLGLADAAGSERDGFAALGNLADIALMAGDADLAVRLGRDLLARLGRRHQITRAIALGNLLLALLTQGATAEARAVAVAFAETSRQLAYLYVDNTSEALAWLALQEGRWAAAARLLGYSDAQRIDREPNEARARDRVATALAVHFDADTLQAEMAQGAVLAPAAACALALDSASGGAPA
jgi:predicted ATPase